MLHNKTKVSGLKGDDRELQGYIRPISPRVWPQYFTPTVQSLASVVAAKRTTRVRLDLRGGIVWFQFGAEVVATCL